MKPFTFFILALLFLAITSCKKDSPAAVSIAGYWSGIGVDNTSTASPLGFLYRSDGTARAYFTSADTVVANKANATYSISDSIRTIVTNGSTVTQFAAALDANGTEMDGTFRRTTINYHGDYAVTKQ